MRAILTLLLLSPFLVAVLGATKYVATTGSNSNDGSIGSPWLTIRYGAFTMGNGDTLNIRGGTYGDDGFSVTEFKSGPSVSQHTVIQSYPGEHAVYFPLTTSLFHGFLIAGKSNITINGLEMDATHCISDGIKLTSGSYNITLTNCIVRDCRTGHGLLTSPLVTEQEATGFHITHCTFSRNGWGGTTNLSPLHQVYLQTSSNVLEHCTIIGTTNAAGGGYGIHSYMSAGTNCIYRNNIITECPDAAIGLVGSSCTNFYVYNNLFYKNLSYAMVFRNCHDLKAFNNTCVSNPVSIQLETSTNVTVANNIAFQGAYGIVVLNTGGVTVNNNLGYGGYYYDLKIYQSTGWTTNANLVNISDIDLTRTTNSAVYSAAWVSPSTLNFNLTSASSARNTGASQSGFSDDILGIARPQESVWDMGAYEYVASSFWNATVANVGGIVLNTGPAAYWKLDEVSGTRADSGVNGQNLADNNTVTSNAGIISNAAEFTRANNESLSVVDSSFLSASAYFSVACWVNLTSKGTGTELRFVASKDGVSSGTREWGLYYDPSSDRFIFYTGRTASASIDQVIASTFGSPSTGVWYFIAAKHDTFLGRNYISVNAGVENSAAFTTGPPDSASPFRIGDLDFATVYNWDGRIDEFGFWNKALSFADIAYLYNAGAARTCCPF